MVSFQIEYGWTNAAELEFGIVPNQTIQLVSTYSENNSHTPGGHVPTCPLAGDALSTEVDKARWHDLCNMLPNGQWTVQQDSQVADSLKDEWWPAQGRWWRRRPPDDLDQHWSQTRSPRSCWGSAVNGTNHGQRIHCVLLICGRHRQHYPELCKQVVDYCQ